MTNKVAERKYETLSPFELKNKLIEMAGTNAEKEMLNAGRGNPNWVAVEPRQAFFQLGQFALEESNHNVIREGFGGMPLRENIAQRFSDFLVDRESQPGIKLLQDSVSFVEERLHIEPNDFLLEMSDAILGDHYPVPDRMLNCCEKIVDAYLAQEMGYAQHDGCEFDFFATEGGTAAMAYVFNSLMENKILKKGDKIAIGTPVFTPYLEIPHLNDFEFVELDIEQDEASGWKYSAEQIEKLADPEVKAFFLVNPSNPTSFAMHPESIKAIRELVETRRKDLVVLTDDVYGTFVNGFQSIASAIPKNTILVYSYSKFFGATGWRIGVIGLAKDNILDDAIQNLPSHQTDELRQRYSRVYLNPDNIKLIDRMVADSRAVALNHTAGLSTPQQVFMAMLSLFILNDSEGVYKEHAQDIVISRFNSLYEALGIPGSSSPYCAHYYTTIDVPMIATERYGEEFTVWLKSEHEPIDFVWRLAEEKSVVLMDGGGFDAPDMSVRVSLANLEDEAYAKIGKAISELLETYHNEFTSK
jgi:aspartate 4-decarboxylase